MSVGPPNGGGFPLRYKGCRSYLVKWENKGFFNRGLRGFCYGFTVGILKCLFRQSLNLFSMQASAFSLSALTVSWASQLSVKPSGVFELEELS
jgi:hypothetical protein